MEIVILECDYNYNITHYKDNKGLEYWKRYNENGLELYYADSNGILYTKEYKRNYILTEYNYPNGKQIRCKYDYKGNILSL